MIINYHLTFKALRTILEQTTIYFCSFFSFFFSEKIMLDITCESSAKQTIKHYFLWEIRKTCFENVVCQLWLVLKGLINAISRVMKILYCIDKLIWFIYLFIYLLDIYPALTYVTAWAHSASSKPCFSGSLSVFNGKVYNRRGGRCQKIFRFACQ